MKHDFSMSIIVLCSVVLICQGFFQAGRTFQSRKIIRELNPIMEQNKKKEELIHRAIISLSNQLRTNFIRSEVWTNYVWTNSDRRYLLTNSIILP